MSTKSVEEIKKESHHLRGQIVETLQSEVSHFEEAEYQLLKYHGTYQQDDRDLRAKRKQEGLDKAYSFMVRSKIPGGEMTAEQYLMHEVMSDDLANHTLRITTRQGFQVHGILKGRQIRNPNRNQHSFTAFICRHFIVCQDDHVIT